MATSKYWVKLYHETVTDWKFMRLPDPARLLFYDSLCMAGDMDAGGRLPPISGMAFILHKTEAYIMDALKPLIESRMILEDELGNYYIANFEKRQGGMTGNERIRRFRDNQKHIEYKNATYQQQNGNGSCNGTVTDCYTDKEIDIDIDKEVNDPEFSKLRDAFVQATGIPEFTGNPHIWVDSIKEWIKMGAKQEDVPVAVNINIENNYPVQSPKSITKTLITAIAKRNNKSNPSRRTKRQLNMDTNEWEDVPQ